MEGLKYDIESKPGEIHHLTVYSDLHFEAWASDQKKLKAHMERRAALPNSMFFGIGDFFDCIRPGDNRYAEGNTKDSHADRGKLPKGRRISRAYRNMVDDFVKFAGHYPWKAIGIGNHEDVAIRRHDTDPAADLADTIGADWAGYSGMARFRFHLGSGAGAKCQFNMLYHHGKYGGQTAIPPGMIRWARGYDGWDVCVFGHHHMTGMMSLARIGWTSSMRMYDRSQIILATGTSLRGYTQGGDPAYSERAAYPPNTLCDAPLIKLRPTNKGCHYSAELGEHV